MSTMCSQRLNLTSPDFLATSARVAALDGELEAALDLMVQVEQRARLCHGSPSLTVAQLARGIAYITAGLYSEVCAAPVRIFDPRNSNHHFREQFGISLWMRESEAEIDAAEVPSNEGHQSDAAGSQFVPEIKITRFPASGLSDEQIGERIFLSPCTAGSHLYRIFPKPGISSRVQLCEALSCLAIAVESPRIGLIRVDESSFCSLSRSTGVHIAVDRLKPGWSAARILKGPTREEPYGNPHLRTRTI